MIFFVFFWQRNVISDVLQENGPFSSFLSFLSFFSFVYVFDILSIFFSFTFRPLPNFQPTLHLETVLRECNLNKAYLHGIEGGRLDQVVRRRVVIFFKVDSLFL